METASDVTLWQKREIAPNTLVPLKTDFFQLLSGFMGSLLIKSSCLFQIKLIWPFQIVSHRGGNRSNFRDFVFCLVYHIFKSSEFKICFCSHWNL